MVEHVKSPRVYSMTTHVMVGVLLIHMVLLPILYATIIDIYKKNAEEQFIGHVREVTGLLSDVLAANESIKSTKKPVLLMESALLGGEVLYIELVDKNDKRLFPDEDIALITYDFIEDTYIGEHDDGIYFISVPLELQLDTTVNANLKIGFDESVVVNRLAIVKQRSLILLGVYFVCIIVLLSYFTSVIMRPLKVLRDWSKSVSEGKTGTHVEVETYISEVRNLTDNLEGMRLSLVELADHMQHKALHDDLTGLPNRSLNDDRIKNAISRASREEGTFAVMLLDLDRFKDINDTLGHGVGDQVLMIVAERLESGIRDYDTVSRIGGDEFCAVIEGVGRVVAEKLAMKLSHLLEPQFQANGHTLQVGVSIGIAVYPVDGNTSELLIQHADVAMYEAKQHDQKVISYHKDMDKHKVEDLQLSSDMRDGIKSDQFFAVFQPKVDLNTGKPCGCELLTRWNHPRMGILSPEKFITLIERENIIGEMTMAVFDKHLSQLKHLVETYPDFKISINVSPLNLLDVSLLDDLIVCIKDNGFDASSLIIEVTENAIMSNPMRSASILQKFSDEGFGISVDDFGTGYSSLTYLQKFPIDELKIDKSFILNLHKHSQNYPIVNATITMAHDLGMSVIAEGVEDRDVIELLMELECNHAQGYYFSKPLSFEELTKWLDGFDIADYK